MKRQMVENSSTGISHALMPGACPLASAYEAPADGSCRLLNPENTSFQYYPANSLSKVVTYDADNKSVTVFSDLFGKKILERTAAGDTYYVYNDLGQLRFVLPPAYNEISRSKEL